MKQDPLTKPRFMQIAALYDHLEMSEQGGYDTGMWFSFRAMTSNATIKVPEHVRYGRIVRPDGFCSPRIVITRGELLRPRGVTEYLVRVETMGNRYKRWLVEAGKIQ